MGERGGGRERERERGGGRALPSAASYRESQDSHTAIPKGPRTPGSTFKGPKVTITLFLNTF